jgi:predicted CoA-binding protein
MSMELETEPYAREDDMRAMLTRPATIALIIASPKPDRPSYQVMNFLLQQGFRVIPVNPGHPGAVILGQSVFARLSDIPEPVDMVDVFRHPDGAPDIARDAIKIGARGLWLQIGVTSPVAAELARAAGLRVVMDRCPAIELPRLFGATG